MPSGARREEENQKAKVTDPQLLTSDPQAETEACFLKAVTIARQRQAKSWEPRIRSTAPHARQQSGATRRGCTFQA